MSFLLKLFKKKDAFEGELRAAVGKLSTYEAAVLRELRKWQGVPAQRAAEVERTRDDARRKLLLLYSWALTDLLDTFYTQAHLQMRRAWLRTVIDAAIIAALDDHLKMVQAWKSVLARAARGWREGGGEQEGGVGWPRGALVHSLRAAHLRCLCFPAGWWHARCGMVALAASGLIAWSLHLHAVLHARQRCCLSAVARPPAPPPPHPRPHRRRELDAWATERASQLKAVEEGRYRPGECVGS
jgi:hypothetical protein